MTIWQILEIEPTTDINEIKRAYAKQLKLRNPETHAEAFQQLRQAYELAQKHASGLNVDVNSIGSADKKNVDNEQGVNLDPVATAHRLLDVLYEDQKKAFTLLGDLHKNGSLDNLAFSEQFQKILAINLLVATPAHFDFICYAIDLFNWYDTLKSNPPDAYFAIALRNLINQTNPYRFVINMRYLSDIKTNKEAKKNNLDWNACCAAKILINPVNHLKFYYIVLFKPQITHAILAHLETLENQYPQALGWGFSLSSVAWWYKYRLDGGLQKRFLRLGITLLIVCIAAAVLRAGIMSPAVETKTDAVNVVESAAIANEKPMRESKTVDKITYQIQTENEPHAVLVNLDLNKPFDNHMINTPDPAITDFNEMSGDKIDQVADKHNIYIFAIVEQALEKQLNHTQQTKWMKSLSQPIHLSIKIKSYGFKMVSNGKKSFIPMVELTLSAEQQGKVLFQDEEVSNDELNDSYGASAFLLKEPEYIESAWKDASASAVNNVIELLKKNINTKAH